MQVRTPTPVMQQAPVGGGAQIPAVVQEVPLPRYVPLCAAQSVCESCWQATPVGVGMQQAPVGGGGAHSVEEQTVPSPRYRPFWAVHWSWVTTTQKTPL